GQVVERIEGGRSSRDDAVQKFIEAEQRAGRKVSEAQLDLTVRKNARANLEGNIVRRLTGMSGVTIEELAECWRGTDKDVSHCILGRGYGQGQKPTPRARANDSGDGDFSADPPPPCPKCGAETRYVAAGKKGKFAWKAGWACAAQPSCKSKGVKGAWVDAAEWHQSVTELQPAASAGESQPEPGWEG